jgi:hypothetical protein
VIDIIQQRLALYKAANAMDEDHATKEILQEVALYSLWRGKFFDVAAFHGGTSLRILYKLPRFSEDLDFILKDPTQRFDWESYLPHLRAGLQQFGLKSEVLDKSRMDRNIREAVLKDSSISNQLNLRFARPNVGPTLKIKLEIDVNPPEGSGFAYTYLDFPLDFELCHQDLPSNFSLKIHALLCRPYVKGRDWYDFGWYLRQKVQPNLPHLQAALHQAGPWKDQPIHLTTQWIIEQLLTRIAAIDWNSAAADVERFLGPDERASLSLWSEKFFANKATQLKVQHADDPI